VFKYLCQNNGYLNLTWLTVCTIERERFIVGQWF